MREGVDERLFSPQKLRKTQPGERLTPEDETKSWREYLRKAAINTAADPQLDIEHQAARIAELARNSMDAHHDETGARIVIANFARHTAKNLGGSKQEIKEREEDIRTQVASFAGFGQDFFDSPQRK